MNWGRPHDARGSLESLPVVMVTHQENIMELLATTPVLGAIGYSIVYMLAGGGLFGAIVIFIIAKAIGK